MALYSTESRYFATGEETNDEAVQVVAEREPYAYRDRSDNISHVASEGDSWQTIAERYYSSISSRACGLWWVVAEYQPTPIVDPTLQIRKGKVITVPAPIVVINEILPDVRSPFL